MALGLIVAFGVTLVAVGAVGALAGGWISEGICRSFQALTTLTRKSVDPTAKPNVNPATSNPPTDATNHRLDDMEQ